MEICSTVHQDLWIWEWQSCVQIFLKRAYTECHVLFWVLNTKSHTQHTEVLSPCYSRPKLSHPYDPSLSLILTPVHLPTSELGMFGWRGCFYGRLPTQTLPQEWRTSAAANPLWILNKLQGRGHLKSDHSWGQPIPKDWSMWAHTGPQKGHAIISVHQLRLSLCLSLSPPSSFLPFSSPPSLSPFLHFVYKNQFQDHYRKHSLIKLPALFSLTINFSREVTLLLLDIRSDTNVRNTKMRISDGLSCL